MLQLLPTFYGRFNEKSYEFLEELTNICMTYNYPGVSEEHLKMRIIFLELKDKDKEWSKLVGQEFTSWSDFLRKFYSFDKTNALRRGIKEFTHVNDNFNKAWERFMALTRKFPLHGIPSWELVQTFYEGLNDNERNMVDISRDENFVKTYAEESMQLIERLVENQVYLQSFYNSGRNSAPKWGGIIDVKAVKPEYHSNKVERDI